MLDVVGPQALRQTCRIDRPPQCGPSVDCPIATITVGPGTNGGVRRNTATVGTANTADPDLNINSAAVNFTVEPRAGVIVTRTATPSPAVAGQDLIYLFAAENLGNALRAAETVTIFDTLSANRTFLSAQPASSSCGTGPTAGSVTGPGNELIQCNPGTLNGSQQTVTIIVRPNRELAGGDLEKSASVTTTTIETDTANNEATQTVPVQAPVFDLLVGKADGLDSVAVGEDTGDTLRIGNLGPSTAENVVVTSTLPPSWLSFQSVSVPADASCTISATPDVIGGTYPLLGKGESRDILVTMRGVSKGVAVSTATVAADCSALCDVELPNNGTSQNTTVRIRTDVEVTGKVPDNSTRNLGEALTYTVHVTDIAGPAYSEADFVVPSETQPTGMVLTGAPTGTAVTGSTAALAWTGAKGQTGPPAHRSPTCRGRRWKMTSRPSCR